MQNSLLNLTHYSWNNPTGKRRNVHFLLYNVLKAGPNRDFPCNNLDLKPQNTDIFSIQIKKFVFEIAIL